MKHFFTLFLTRNKTFITLSLIGYCIYDNNLNRKCKVQDKFIEYELEKQKELEINNLR
jgi:hypothetical protein